MSWRTKLGHWIAGSKKERASTAPMDWEPSFSRWFGPGVGHQPPPRTLLRESVGVPDMAARAISNRLASLVPQVKMSEQVESGTLQDVILDDHPLAMLLEKPHPNLSWRQIMRLAGRHIVDVGEAYWLKVGNGLGRPVELHPVPAGHVWPLVRQGVLQGYMVRDGDGKEDVLPPDVLIRFFFPDPENPWASEGYLGPTGIVADAHKFASEHLRWHYQKDATPKTALKPDEMATAPTQDQKEEFYDLWRQQFQSRGGDLAGIPPLLPIGWDLITIAMQTGADIRPLLEYWEDQMLMHYGVPKSILGKVVAGDRSAAEVNQFVFDLHTIFPIASMMADTLTDQLARDFSSGLFVEFAPFIAGDKQFQLQQEEFDLEHGVRNINEVRSDRNWNEVDWGEKPLMSTKLSVFDPDAAPFAPGTEGQPQGTNLSTVPSDEPEDDEDRSLKQQEADLHAKVRQLFREKRKKVA